MPATNLSHENNMLYLIVALLAACVLSLFLILVVRRYKEKQRQQTTKIQANIAGATSVEKLRMGDMRSASSVEMIYENGYGIQPPGPGSPEVDEGPGSPRPEDIQQNIEQEYDYDDDDVVMDGIEGNKTTISMGLNELRDGDDANGAKKSMIISSDNEDGNNTGAVTMETDENVKENDEDALAESSYNDGMMIETMGAPKDRSYSDELLLDGMETFGGIVIDMNEDTQSGQKDMNDNEISYGKQETVGNDMDNVNIGDDEFIIE